VLHDVDPHGDTVALHDVLVYLHADVRKRVEQSLVGAPHVLASMPRLAEVRCGDLRLGLGRIEIDDFVDGTTDFT